MKHLRPLLIILSLLFSFSLTAEEKPSWVTYEEARELVAEGKLAEAIIVLENAIDEEITFPEAEYELGLIFYKQGEYDLAEQHFLKAIGQKRYLSVDASYYTIVYTLAKMYLDIKKYNEMESLLFNNILAYDDTYVGNKNKKNREIWINALKEKGIDKLLLLYRYDESFSYDAHIILAEFYTNSGRYDKGLEHSLLAVMMFVSTAVESMIKEDHLFQFSGLDMLWEKLQNNDLYQDYITTHRPCRALYFLANSLYGLAYDEEAKKIWTFVAEHSTETGYKNLAKNQILKPDVRPVYAK
ncbi:hypothetical protein WKV44_04050 [Spirochaetia bacterium 38H-sp]|uniref:Tetratricopeptide repeat protein n=1 Tax=Rarispira pelagica TaxID=3141764 RepID=A0ABU9UAM3_9SPIR